MFTAELITFWKLFFFPLSPIMWFLLSYSTSLTFLRGELERLHFFFYLFIFLFLYVMCLFLLVMYVSRAPCPPSKKKIGKIISNVSLLRLMLNS